MGNGNSVIENGDGVSASPLRRLHVGQRSVGHRQFARGRLASEQRNMAERDAFAAGQRIECGKATGDVGWDGGRRRQIAACLHNPCAMFAFER